MERRDGQNPYEFLSPQELKEEAARLLSQFPRESAGEHVGDQEKFFELVTRRSKSEHGEILSQRFCDLLKRANITESFRSFLYGHFEGRYSNGGEGTVLEWWVLGNEGTMGIFDPDIARKTEYGIFVGWTQFLQPIHEMNSKYMEQNPEITDASANDAIIDQVSRWRHELHELHGEQLA